MVHLKQNIHRVVTKVGSVVGRKKTDDGDISLEGPQLPRVLGFADLTLLGVGSTLGVGVYVLAGTVAKTDAGPAVTLSFLVAAIASALAGICYAEFAARVPKAGSAYVYSYVTVGELAAFVIGWNLILEYVIGTASVARAFSAYLDQMSGKVIANALTEAMPLHVDFLSPYPDFLSLGIVLILTALLAYGVRESAYMNNIFTAFNLLTVVTVIVAGLFQVDSYNWSIPKDKIPEGVKGGEGGFLPFGVSGVMAGAAKCFFGFVGFDCVATTGEEAKNPQRHIPLAIVTSLVIIFASYFGISTVLTMMIPYYAQDADAPLVKAFDDTGMHVISMIVSAGAVFALCTSLLGSMFPMPRMFYSMAKDGLLYRKLATVNATTETAIFATILSGILSGCMLPAPRLLYSMGKDKTLWKFLATISDRSRTPLKATLVAGGISGIMAALFNLEQLIDMMSIGTLLAYTVVALCVLLLRYRDSKPPMYEPNTPENEAISWTQSITNLINYSGISQPDKTTTNVAEVSTGLFVALTFITTLVISSTEDTLSEGDMTPLYAIVVLIILTCLPVVVIAFQPQENPPVFFKVPLLPVLPCISIFINVYLMMKLDLHTWIRFGAWLVIGGVIYIFYSIPNSVEGQKDKLAKQNEKLRM